MTRVEERSDDDKERLAEPAPSSRDSDPSPTDCGRDREKHKAGKGQQGIRN